MGLLTPSQYNSATAISWTIMPVILAALPPAVIAGGKAAAGVGLTATGTIAGYGIIRAIQKGDEPTPQI